MCFVYRRKNRQDRHNNENIKPEGRVRHDLIGPGAVNVRAERIYTYLPT